LHVPTLSSIKSCARAIQRGGAPSALAVGAYLEVYLQPECLVGSPSQ